MKNFNYLMDHIYQIFKIILNIYLKTWRKDCSIRIYINKIENKITFKINPGYYLERLMSQTIKLLGSTKRKTTKNENGENLPNLEIMEVILVHCNIANNNYQKNSRIFHTFVPNNSFGDFLDVSSKTKY